MTPIDDPKKERVFQASPVEKMFEPPVPTLGTGLSGMGRVIGSSGVANPVQLAGLPAVSRPEVNGVQWKGGGFGPLKEDMASGAGAIAITSGPNAGKNIAVGPQTYTAPDGTPTSTHRGSQENLQGIADAENIKKQLANIQRMRLETDAFDPTITDPNVRASARAALAEAGVNKERDARISNDAVRAGLDRDRLDILRGDSMRSAEKWGVEKGIMQGQAEDSAATRKARSELTAAIESGDPAKIESARAKAVAAGIKFDKPNNEFSAVTDSMGMNITRTNKDTGAVDIIDGKTGAVKASIPAPGQRPAQQAAPASAIEYLKKNPAQAAAFKAKYGYLPEGF